MYVHRESIPLTLLSEGLEKLRYEEVVTALVGVQGRDELEKVRFPLSGEAVS